MNNDNMDGYLTQTFRFLEICIPKSLLSEIKKATYEDLFSFHFSFGIWLRNNILNKASVLYDYFVCTGIEHPDDMSSIIIHKFHQYLNRS